MNNPKKTDFQQPPEKIDLQQPPEKIDLQQPPKKSKGFFGWFQGDKSQISSIRIGIWGTTGSGKTIYLARLCELLSAGGKFTWLDYVNFYQQEESLEFNLVVTKQKNSLKNYQTI